MKKNRLWLWILLLVLPWVLAGIQIVMGGDTAYDTSVGNYTSASLVGGKNPLGSPEETSNTIAEQVPTP